MFIPKRPGEPEITYADIRKIKKDINWRPRIPITEGVRLVLKSINDWKNAPIWTPKKINIATKKWFLYLKK